ncbi:phylloplanin-like [Magnolia sinica]|uniref:phylloplanin-like n=1 Tax=Magnolia sinica TaxID=86752 RepID=UPI002657E0DD|nr:phylloplanin-like [Magnolia sinica]
MKCGAPKSKRAAATWPLLLYKFTICAALQSTSVFHLIIGSIPLIKNKPMALKSLLFGSLLLVGVAAPLAVAQLGGLGNLLGGLINIRGTIFCTVNGNANGTSTPVFPNAQVQLQCGNTVTSSTTTNSAGLFTMLLDPLTTLLSSLLNDCKLVVNTPLSTCNAMLPTGLLQSPLQFLGKTLQGILGILNVGPAGFSLIPSN